MNGLCLTPSAVIGLGAWGREVAREFETALRERSPELVRACPVLAIDGDDVAVPEKIRAHLRASRLAETFRALQQEGLMQLDPVLSPATHVYLVASAADDDLLRDVAELVNQAAGELKAAVVRIALVDVGGGARLPGAVPGVQCYLLEPVTCQGLILDADEYRAAAVEALLAVVQPGGGDILIPPRAPGPGQRCGTLGIAWLQWSPASLRSGLAARLSREAVLRCLESGSPGVPIEFGDRVEALLAGLDFLAVPGDLAGRADPGRYLRRCAAVLDRRAQRWERALERRAARRREEEARTLADAVAAAPSPAAARSLVAGVVERREPAPPDGPEFPRGRSVAAALREMDRAATLPAVNAMAGALGFVGLISIGMARLLGGQWPVLLAWGALLALTAAGYAAFRPWRLRQTAAGVASALQARASHLAEAALAHHLEALDQALSQRANALLAELDQALEHLRSQCRVNHPEAQPTRTGALSFPLVDDGALEPYYHDLQAHVADLATHLAAAGVLRDWRQPDLVLAQAESLTRSFLAGRGTPDPAQLATRAHGERLAQRLQTAVRGLLDWSQPLLARAAQPLPEGRRWLLWPDGLPCPPVPPEVTVLPASRSCAAVVTVVHGVSAGTEQYQRRKIGESTTPA